MYLLLTKFEVHTVSYTPKVFPLWFMAQVQSALQPYASLEAIRIDNDDGDEDTKCTGHTSKGKKHRSVTYSTNQEEVSNLDIYY